MLRTRPLRPGRAAGAAAAAMQRLAHLPFRSRSPRLREGWRVATLLWASPPYRRGQRRVRSSGALLQRFVTGTAASSTTLLERRARKLLARSQLLFHRAVASCCQPAAAAACCAQPDSRRCSCRTRLPSHGSALPRPTAQSRTLQRRPALSPASALALALGPRVPARPARPPGPGRTAAAAHRSAATGRKARRPWRRRVPPGARRQALAAGGSGSGSAPGGWSGQCRCRRAVAGLTAQRRTF